MLCRCSLLSPLLAEKEIFWQKTQRKISLSGIISHLLRHSHMWCRHWLVLEQRKEDIILSSVSMRRRGHYSMAHQNKRDHRESFLGGNYGNHYNHPPKLIHKIVTNGLAFLLITILGILNTASNLKLHYSHRKKMHKILHSIPWWRTKPGVKSYDTTMRAT